MNDAHDNSQDDREMLARLAWTGHDPLCQHYRSQGKLPCDCSESCFCKACCELCAEGLRYFHRAHPYPDTFLREAHVESALVRAYAAGARRRAQS